MIRDIVRRLNGQLLQLVCRAAGNHDIKKTAAGWRASRSRWHELTQLNQDSNQEHFSLTITVLFLMILHILSSSNTMITKLLASIYIKLSRLCVCVCLSVCVTDVSKTSRLISTKLFVVHRGHRQMWTEKNPENFDLWCVKIGKTVQNGPLWESPHRPRTVKVTAGH